MEVVGSGNQIFAAEPTRVSMDTKMKSVGLWKTDRCCGNNRCVHGYKDKECGLVENIVAAEPTGVSMDTKMKSVGLWKTSLLRNQQVCPWIRR
jgi:hypothetical protein